MEGIEQLEKTKNLKHFLTMTDLTGDDIHELIDDAILMKQQVKDGVPHPHLQGKTLGMIFEKSSTRTRVSFEVGMLQLGGHALFLSSQDIQLGRGETVSDTSQVLSRYVDGLMIRTFAHATVEEFAASSSVPVINGLTDPHHPTQVLADLMTIYETKGKLAGLKMSYIGDGNNNMTHSLLEGAALVGMDMAVSSPKGFEPDESIFQAAKAIGLETGANITFHKKPEDAVHQADVIVTDVWASMGEEDELETRKQFFKPFQINQKITEYAKNDYLFLHCLPAHRGEEVTAEIIDGKHSRVFDEAENRLHAQKALLKKLLKN
ncbi:ornithine carbamoyltransferase [Salipaludibacillus neizhouensis]|uniref:ornithine carbamoyltransferase n=1 Tax=Salipaludibacillus neizhouensis TaxID=885475 RepID=UPI0016030BF3|nr:ornithine carbamoyltransferase [Salipaludibacillus neizhouensis]